MNINNFVINRVRRASMFSTTNGVALWNITQVENPSLSVTTDKNEAVDALGVKIMEFERAKNAEFTAENSLFDFGLAAAQSGTEKREAAVGTAITMPKWEEVKLTQDQIGATKITLAEVPVGTSGSEIPFIYRLNGDGTLAEKYSSGLEAAAATFVLNAASKELTLPTGLKAGDRLWIPYEFACQNGVEVYNTAIDFPKAGKFVMEVLGVDVCDTTKEYYAYVVFPNAKLNGDFDLSFTTDGKHPFTIQAMQQYCDAEKRLFSILIPDAV